MAYTLHDGTKFRVEINPMYGSKTILCKSDGRYAYVSGADAHKLGDALITGWNKFGMDADGDTVWQWIWTNCGFHRFAS